MKKIIKLNVNFNDLRVKIPDINKISENKKWKYYFLNSYFNNKEYKININCIKFELYEYDNDKYGQLYAYFNIKDWDIYKNGLIYNNPAWIKDFRKSLSLYLKTNITKDDINYSEQGMQGINYVHMDISPKIYNLILNL
jgi:hypothetical protein